MKLDIDHISKKFGPHNALCNITCHIPECRSIAILGPSGGGKSTLLRLIAGLEYPDGGTIAINGKEIVYSEEELLKHRRSVGTVFQSWNLFPHLTALENIRLPLEKVHGLTVDQACERGMELLKRFHLQNHANKMPYQLSGGQTQRVAIVRAVAIRPHLLLFDEPTSALDPIMTSEVLDLIVELKQEGINFILASHHVTFSKKIADWVIFLSGGVLQEAAPCQSFFKHPQSLVSQEFLQKVLKH